MLGATPLPRRVRNAVVPSRHAIVYWGGLALASLAAFSTVVALTVPIVRLLLAPWPAAMTVLALRWRARRLKELSHE